MADETLTGRIKVDDDSSGDLEAIAKTFRDVAGSAIDAAQGSYLAADSFDEASDQGNQLNRTLQSLHGTIASSSGMFSGLAGGAYAAAEGVDEVEDEVGAANRKMATGTATAAAYGTALNTLGATGVNTGIKDDVEDVPDIIKDARRAAKESPLGLGQEEWDARKAAKSWEWDNLERLAADAVDPEYKVDVEGEEKALAEMKSVHAFAEGMDGTDIDYKIKASRSRGMQARQAAEEAFADEANMADISNMIFDRDSPARRASSYISTIGRDISDDDVASAREEVRGLGDDISGLPRFDLGDIRKESDLSKLSGDLYTASNESDRLSERFKQLGDRGDRLIADSDSLKSLRRNLKATDYNTEELEDSLNELGRAGRALVDDVLVGAESVDEFDNEAGQLSRRASSASASIRNMSGATRSYTAHAAIGAAVSDEFSDEIREVGNEAIKTEMKLQSTNNMMTEFGEALGDTTTSIGPFTTNLQSVMALLPGLISLLASAGGLLTAGLFGGAGIAGIFAGGLLEQGDQLVDQMEATGEATEEMQEATGAQRSMLGLQELLSRVGNAAYEAFEPLRDPKFADFAMSGIQEGLRLLGEFAEVVAWGSDGLMDFMEVIGAAWWDTYPTFISELVHLMEVFGPMIEDISLAAIEGLPGLFAFMTKEGESVVPMMMDFVGALIDVMPLVAALGTMMLHGLIPNLIGVLEGVEAISPALILAARAITELLQVLDPVIEFLYAVGAAVATVNFIIPFLVWSIQGLTTMMTLLVKVPIMSFLGSLYWVLISAAAAFKMVMSAAIAAWGAILGPITVIVALIAAIAAVITYFNWWDEIIWGLIKSWNLLVDALAFGGTVIANAVIGLVNTVISFFQRIIDIYNKIAEYTGAEKIDMEFQMMETYDYGEDHLGYLKMDPSKSDEYASMIPGQDSSKGGNLLQNKFSRGSDEFKGPERLAGDSYQENNYYIEGMGGSGDAADEKRIESAVQRGVKRANRKDRLKNSELN